MALMIMVGRNAVYIENLSTANISTHHAIHGVKSKAEIKVEHGMNGFLSFG